MTDKHTRLTVLLSGSGTNLQALIDACNTPALPSTSIVRVVSNLKNAYGLERARKAGIPVANLSVISYKERYPEPTSKKATSEKARNAFDADLAQLVLVDKPDLIVCAGWMRILTPSFLTPMQDSGIPIINLHPALPGEFDGTHHAISEAYEAFQQGKIARTGIMVHYVILDVDKGKPILTKEIPLAKGESLEEVEQKIHQNEWQLIVQATKLAIDERRASKHGENIP